MCVLVDVEVFVGDFGVGQQWCDIQCLVVWCCVFELFVVVVGDVVLVFQVGLEVMLGFVEFYQVVGCVYFGDVEEVFELVDLVFLVGV